MEWFDTDRAQNPDIVPIIYIHVLSMGQKDVGQKPKLNELQLSELAQIQSSRCLKKF